MAIFREDNSNKTNRKRHYILLCFIFLGACVYTLLFQSVLFIPHLYRVALGERVFLGRSYLPKQISKQIVAYVADGGERLSWRTGKAATQAFYPFLGQSPIAVLPGMIDLDLRLFGIFPLKRITLEVVPPVKVVVGGHSIGVLVHAQGVVVVGYAEISGGVCPAREVGILPGDVIVRIEGKAVQSDSQVSFLIDSLAQQKDQLRVQVKRGDEYKEFKVRPVYCSETRRYRIGLYIRDGAAGIGTLTFFEPATRVYGALGHMICDSKNNKSLDLHDGRVVEASVQGIQRGRRGRIGEKIGIFMNGGKISGDIRKNTTYGIFGTMQEGVTNSVYKGLIPVAMGYQIREGKAKMLTVLSGNKIEEFDVEIIRVFGQPRPDGKAFIIRVVDEELLDRAGGIVQGMSGSPIIQDGRLVGAVTHVFINDPTRGYGVLAESMLAEAGLLSSKETKKQPAFFVWMEQGVA